MPLTLIVHFGETPENGRDSRQKMSNPVSKSFQLQLPNPCNLAGKSS